MVMNYYSELFDTARNKAEERAAARTILQLLALAGPVQLSAIHAANSEFILDDVAGVEGFKKLVEHGRIVFRKRHDKASPEEWLKSYLHAEDATYTIWAGSAEERRDFLATLAQDGRHLQAVDDMRADFLEARLDRMRSLWSMNRAKWRNAPDEHPAERRVGDMFQREMKHVHEHMSHPSAIGLIELVRRAGKDRNRTQVYQMLDFFAEDPSLAPHVVAAKDAVDAIHSKTVAVSLDSSLMSVRGPDHDLKPSLHVGGTVSGNVEMERGRFSGSKLGGYRFEWHTIKDLVLGEGDVEHIVEQLALSLTTEPALVEFAPEAALHVMVGVGVIEMAEELATNSLATLVHAPHSLLEFAVISALTMAELVVPERLKEILRENRRQKLKHELRGYLDALTNVE